MVQRLAALAIGYLFGLFQTAYFYGKWKGIDIRRYGSGNAGSTNTLRVLGTGAGLIVLAGDILKCILAIVVVRLLFGSRQDMYYLLAIYAATGVILGHDFPFYLQFNGGKGIAATAGLILSFHPAFIPVGVLIFFGIFFTTHYVSLGSLVACVGFLVEMVILGQMGVFGMTQAQLVELYCLSAFIVALAFWQHRGNIRRLLEGKERKTYLFRKNTDAA